MAKILGWTMNITECLKEKDYTLIEMQEPSDSNYTCFNTGGVETAVGEFLYGMVRMMRPEYVFETGTHHGISSSYMAKALQDNKFGTLTTVEINKENIRVSEERWERIGIRNQVIIDKEHSLKYTLEHDVQLMLLDSEPEFRFKELVRFYQRLAFGGYVFIHDMPRNMCQGNVNTDHPNAKSWPYGDLPLEIVDWVKDRMLLPFHFGTPRGLVGFYKPHKDDYKWL